MAIITMSPATIITKPITVLLTSEGLLEPEETELDVEEEVNVTRSDVTGNEVTGSISSSGLHSLSPKDDMVIAQFPSALSS